MYIYCYRLSQFCSIQIHYSQSYKKLPCENKKIPSSLSIKSMYLFSVFPEVSMKLELAFVIRFQWKYPLLFCFCKIGAEPHSQIFNAVSYDLWMKLIALFKLALVASEINGIKTIVSILRL